MDSYTEYECSWDKRFDGKIFVYVDFGENPGRDKMLRESASQDCCIISGKNGSSVYYEDLMIPDEYKFNFSKENIPHIIEKIKEVLENILSISVTLKLIKRLFLMRRLPLKIRWNKFLQLPNMEQNKKAFGVNMSGFFNAEIGFGEAIRNNLKALETVDIPTKPINFNLHLRHRLNDNSVKYDDGINNYPINIVHVNMDTIGSFLQEKSSDF